MLNFDVLFMIPEMHEKIRLPHGKKLKQRVFSCRHIDARRKNISKRTIENTFILMLFHFSWNLP